MNISNAARAEILTQALPYIREYYDKTVVVKYGGNAMINEELKEAVMGDLVLLSLIGIKVVLVHGGGPEITETLAKMGKKSEFVDGLRVTDKETVDVVQMVLAGRINKNLVNLLEGKGGRAMGLCGIDGHMLRAKPVSDKLGYVGEITSVDVKPINDLLEKGYIPVVSSVACDEDGNVYNVNADSAAAAISGAVGKEAMKNTIRNWNASRNAPPNWRCVSMPSSSVRPVSSPVRLSAPPIVCWRVRSSAPYL